MRRALLVLGLLLVGTLIVARPEITGRATGSEGCGGALDDEVTVEGFDAAAVSADDGEPQDEDSFETLMSSSSALSQGAANLDALLQQLKALPTIKPHLKSYYDVTDCNGTGAIPNDGHDDWQALQGCINLALQNGEVAKYQVPVYNNPNLADPVVYLPGGTYHISKPLVVNLPGYTNQRAIRIVGDWSSIVAQPPEGTTLDAVMSFPSGGVYFTLERLILDAAHKATHGLRAWKTGTGIAQFDALVVTGAIAHGVMLQLTQILALRNILSYGNGGSGFRLRGANASVFHRCAAIGNGLDGFDIISEHPLNDGPYGGGCFLRETMSFANGRHGYHLRASLKPDGSRIDLAGVAIRDGHLGDNVGDGIRIGGRNANISRMRWWVGTQPAAGSRAIRVLADEDISKGNYIADNMIPTGLGPEYAAIAVTAAGQEAKNFIARNGVLTVVTEGLPGAAIDTDAGAAPSGAVPVGPPIHYVVQRLLGVGASKPAPPPKYFDIMDYGAVPNDEMDDSHAITAAITAALAAPPAANPVVWIPRGIFSVGSEVVINGGGQNKQLVIDSEWGALVYEPSYAGRILSLNNLAAASLHKVTISGAGGGLRLANMNMPFSKLERVGISTTAGDALALDGVNRIAMYSVSTSDAPGANIRIKNTRVGAMHLSSVRSKGDGIYVESSPALKLDALHSEGNVGKSVVLMSPGRNAGAPAVITDGWFEANIGDAFYIARPNVTIAGINARQLGTAANPNRVFRMLAGAANVTMRGNSAEPYTSATLLAPAGLQSGYVLEGNYGLWGNIWGPLPVEWTP